MVTVSSVEDLAPNLELAEPHGTPGSGMSALLSCPTCGLEIAPRANWWTMTHCPRCIADSRAIVERRDSRGTADSP